MKLIAVAACFAVIVPLATGQTYTFSTLLETSASTADQLDLMRWPTGITVDRAGNLYVVESGRNAIRKIPPGGVMTTFAGLPGSRGTADGPGTEARFSAPYSPPNIHGETFSFGTLGIVADQRGNIFVADTGNHTVRKIDPNGLVTTFAGMAGHNGSEDGVGSSARFYVPASVAVDDNGIVYVADTGNHTVRMINADGTVSTLAGQPGKSGSNDGVGSDARFYYPTSVTVDRGGNVYVASYDDTIRQISPQGVVTTVAGRAGIRGYADGMGGAARFAFSHGFPTDLLQLGMTIDRVGNLFVTDPGNRVIRKVTPTREVTSFGSTEFVWLTGIAADVAGNLYVTAEVAVNPSVTDPGIKSRVLKVVPASTLAITLAPQAQTVALGSTVVFTAVGASTSEVTYQWKKHGAPLPGSTRSTLIIAAATTADAGSYACSMSDATGNALDAEAALQVVATDSAGRLINFSVRSNAGPAPQSLMIGATIAGTDANVSLPILVRVVGPSLSQLGVRGFVTDPAFSLTRGEVSVASNDDWGGDPQIATRVDQVGAFPFLSPTSLDAAIATGLVPNSYHVEITSKSGASGVVLCDLFDATTGGSEDAPIARLVNLSARTQVGSNGDVLIAGFVIGGQTAKTVLLRAVGPSLAALGVGGANADPMLQLFAGPVLIRENHDWSGDSQLATVARSAGAFALASSVSKDAMLLTTLPPGNYTLQVQGQNNDAGIVLAEIFEVP